MTEILINQHACPLLLHEGIGGVMNCPGDKCQWWLSEMRDCTLPVIAKAAIALLALHTEKGGKEPCP